MTELLSAIVEQLKKATPGVDPQQSMMAASMRILGGDWAPFDTMRPALAEYVTKECDGNPTDDAIKSMATKLADDARAGLADNASVNEVFASHIRELQPEEKDPITIIHEALLKHMPITLTIFVRHDDAKGLFSDVLKAAEVELTGEVLEAFSKICEGGDAGLKKMMTALSQRGSMEVMTKYPQHAQAAMFGLPMTLNMLQQFHQQWRAKQQ